MSKSSDDDKDGVPKFSIWDGDADRYLDAVDHFARYARRRHKNGTAEWIWGEACPIKPGMTQAEVNAACNAICAGGRRGYRVQLNAQLSRRYLYIPLTGY